MDIKKLILFLAIWGISVSLKAQIVETNPVIEGSNLRPVTVNGSVGISTSAYSAWGIENRMDPLSAMANANINFSLFGMSSGLNLLYSTTQSQFRQRINDFGFDMTWRWLTVKAGDVRPTFSEFGLNGINIRGGYIKINPGAFLLELTGGQSKRNIGISTNQAFRQAAYQRVSLGGRVGVGPEDGSHFFLSTHYSIDDKNSIKNPLNDINVTPKENLTITPDIRVNFLDKRLTVGVEVTASAFTRDLTSPALPKIGIPQFVRNIFNPHESTRINYAAQFTTSLNLSSVGVKVGYKRIQPGFQSLGLGRVRNDHQVITGAVTKQLFDNKFSWSGNISLGRNNLFNTRLQTQKNKQIGTSLTYRITPTISVTGNYHLMINDFKTNDSQNSPSAQVPVPDRNMISHSITLQPTITMQKNGLTHTISVTGAYFLMNNTIEHILNMPAVPGANSKTFTGTATYNLQMPSGFGIHSTVNYLNSRTNASNTTSYGINVGANYTLLQQKLTLTLTAGINQVRTDITTSIPGSSLSKSRQIMSNFTANYRLSGKDSFSFSFRGQNNSVLNNGGRTFSEIQATLNYRHSF